MKLKLAIVTLLLSAASLLASSVMVKDGYVRATPPGMKNSAAFMMLMNKSDNNLSVVSAKSHIANKVEIHTHDMVDGMMKMYQVKKVDLKANSHTMFKPGGFHVMFLGLKKSLREGEYVSFTLVLNNGEEVKVTAPVKKVMSGMKHGKDKKNGAKCPCGMDAASCSMDHSKMDSKSAHNCKCGSSCKCKASGKKCTCHKKDMKHKM